MKKNCTQCDIPFYGRTDKLFCSAACKNQYHNQLKKVDIAFRVDQSLHHNRTILRQMSNDTPGGIALDRNLLVRLGFNFNVFTGLMHDADGSTGHIIYDFAWTENDQDQIIIRRLEETIPA